MVATTVADVSAKALTPLPESIPAEMRALGEREVLEGPVLSLRGVSAEVSTPPKEVVSLTSTQTEEAPLTTPPVISSGDLFAALFPSSCRWTLLGGYSVLHSFFYYQYA